MSPWLLGITFAYLLATCTARNDLKGEHVAPFSYSVAPRDWLPEDHPVQTLEGNPDLPDGCITYDERYSKAEMEHDRHRVFDANEVHPNSRFVVLVRLHFEVQWKDDLVLFLRSIMHELSEAGLHMYLLVEDALGSEAKPDDTPEKFRHSIPLALRPIAFFYDQNDIHNQYAELHQFKLHAREYLPVIWFMHRYPGYEFAWYIEYDVRYTGPSLGTFLNTALLVATETLQKDDLELEGVTDGLTASAGDRSFFTSTAVHKDLSRLPDLVLMGTGTHSSNVNDESQPRDPDHWNFTHLHHRQVQLFGMSKKYGESLHNYAMEGLGGYIEEFIPTMAKEVGLTVVSVPIPLFITDSFHCCTNASEIYYEEWYTSKQCRQYALLHPIKLKSPIWGAPSLQ